ncbi:hypothetical protein D9611_009590 [Ephemerocybe angulata]|uniref:DUF2855 family protein n=1 Tax=Ephemerocybe angulata TaxID=980116 RepID=A0A8H5FGA5_9AGAR|nr:hypothetical protein D9611_009590 [Tulosesus angulatus]
MTVCDRLKIAYYKGGGGMSPRLLQKYIMSTSRRPLALHNSASSNKPRTSPMAEINTVVDNFTLCSPRPSAHLDTQAPNAAEVDPLSLTVAHTTLDITDIPENHVLIKVDKFGFSTNNITYQALGEHPHFRSYFDFHAAPTPDLAKTHGIIPVWGFGTIASSTHSSVQAGERVYGYFAPTRYLVLPVSALDENGCAFSVHRPHFPRDRQPYHQVIRCAADPGMYAPTPEGEDFTMIYRPLFLTAFWCEDWITGSYGCNKGKNLTVLVASASAKTAVCFIYLIQRRIKTGELPHVSVVGLTSKKNLAFTNSLGLYNDVYTYDSFELGGKMQNEKDRRWIYVDVAGNDSINTRLRTHFSSPGVGQVIKHIALGVTNLVPSTSAQSWSHIASAPDAPEVDGRSPWPAAELFFLPEWLQVRQRQMSMSGVMERQNVSWEEWMADCSRWVQLERVYGPGNVRDDYARIAKEGPGPTVGLVWSMWDGPSP